jgi:hypothetical protein
MKNTYKLLFAAILLTAFAACKKVVPLPFYGNGIAPVLTSSSTDITPVTSDSNKVAVTFSWTNPKYATDSSTQKFIIEIDSSGRNFSKEVTMVVTGVLSKTFLAKELNTILLGFGFAYNVSYDVDVRITSSYANNNEQYQSNVLKLKMTPYVTPPKVVPPASKTLYLIGGATAGSWNNPVPVPAQQFTMIDSVTYQGTFYLNGGGALDFLPVNGSWSSKYNVIDATAAAGGIFQSSTGPGMDIPGPAKTGMYQITVDFQHGIFTVTPVTIFGLLYVPGDYQSSPNWTPATASSLGSPKSDGSFDGYVNIPSGGTYQFKFTNEPDWNGIIYGDTSATGTSGVLGGGNNLAVPGVGFYHIVANTTANTWSASKTTWGIVGSFAASNWGASPDAVMTYNTQLNAWVGTITTAAGDQFKFRANNSWAGGNQNPNLGESGGTGSLVYGGDNIGDPSKNFAVPAGTHTITLFLNNSGYYTYMIQ